MQVPLNHMGPVYALLDQHGVQRMHEDFLEDGSLQLKVIVNTAAVQCLQSDLMNATSGTLKLKSDAE